MCSLFSVPDDTTRVILDINTEPDSSSSGSSSIINDYINASHVVMAVPGSNIINRYIASQGPLNATSPHFWSMVWQQKSTLLVMLTTCIEQGR